MFRYQVRAGLILCAVEPGEDNGAVDLESQTGEEETGTAAGDETKVEDEEEVVVSIGEEAPPSDEEDQPAPHWVKELRKTNRELARENRELKQKQQAEQQSQQAATVMPKPTLAACDYDEDAFESKLAAWHEQQANAKAEQQKKADAEKAASDAWNAKLAAYGKAKAELKVADAEDAEAVARDILSVTQQSIIISGADNPALVVVALGKNPAKAKELASITDPVKYAFAIAKLETQLKVTPRKAPPPPETTVRGSAPVVPGSADANLERLRAEAAKTGDMSKVMAYKRQQRDKSK